MNNESAKPVMLSGTPALKKFTDEHIRLGDFLTYILMLAGTIDRNRKIAIKALANDDELANKPNETGKSLEEQLREADEKGAVAALARHFDLTKEMLVCRAVDNFLSYLTDLLSAIFRSRPETMRSNEQIRIDKVLAQASMDDLISFIADRKINELAYQSMSDLNNYFKEKLGLELFDDEVRKQSVITTILTRNLIVHARGKINEKFLELNPAFGGHVGDEVKMTTEKTFDVVDDLLASVVSIDRRAREKYNLDNSITFEFIEPFTTIRPARIREILK